MQHLLQHLKSQSIFIDIQSHRDELNLDASDPDSGVPDSKPVSRRSTAIDDISSSDQSPWSIHLRKQLEEVPEPSPGTCQWIKSNPDFTRWRTSLKEGDNILLILGDPGVGKTFLAKSIVQGLDRDGKAVWAFFCKSKRSGRASLKSVIATFVYLLLVEEPALWKEKIPEAGKISGPLSLADLWTILVDLSHRSEAKERFLIIDAFDECDHKSQRLFHDLITNKALNQPFKLLITARVERYPDTMSRHLPFLEIKPEVTTDDIACFIDQKLREPKLQIIYNEEMASTLESAVQSESNGMFLKVALLFDDLYESLDDANFSTSSEALQQFTRQLSRRMVDYYKEMLGEALSPLNPRERIIGIDVLNILLAFQDTCWSEDLRAAHAFSRQNFASYTEFLQKSDSNIIDRAKRLCGPILRHKSNPLGEKSVSIVHQTAHEYLETLSTNPQDSSLGYLAEIDVEKGHVLLARACLSILLTPSLRQYGGSLLSEMSFLSYAVIFLPIHLRESQHKSHEYEDLLKRFFKEDDEGQVGFYVIWHIMHEYTYGRAPPIVTPGVLAVFVADGFTNLISLIKTAADGSHSFLGNLIDVNRPSGRSYNALIEAVLVQNHQLILDLIDLGISPIQEVDNGQNALLAAIARGDRKSIQIFANHSVDIDVQNSGSHPLEYQLNPLLTSLNDIETFKQLLSFGADPIRLCGPHNISALHVAAGRGKKDIVEMILGTVSSDQIDLRDGNGATPLMYASSPHGNLDTIKYLIEQAKAQPDLVNKHGFNALYMASRSDNADVVSFLLLRTEDKNASKCSWSPLHAAASRGSTAVIRILIEGGVDADRLNANGDSALVVAIDAGQPEVVLLELAKGMRDVDVHGPEQRPALFKACATGHTELVQELIKKHANTRYCQNEVSCIHSAAYTGRADIVEILIKDQGTNLKLNEIDSLMERTPLLAALAGGQFDAAKILLDAGADMNVKDRHGFTILHYIALENLGEKLFLDAIPRLRKEFVDVPNLAGVRPLHFVARQGWLDATKWLLQLGADPLAEDENFWTPLYEAARSGQNHVVQYMISQNIDYSSELQTTSGSTLLHAASRRCDYETVQLIMKKSNWVCRRRTVDTPIILASRLGNLEAVEALLSGGMNADFTNNSGWTALHEAASKGHSHIISKLLEHNANPSTVDHDNRIPLLCANFDLPEDVRSALRPGEDFVRLRDSHDLSSYASVSTKWEVSDLKFCKEMGVQLDCRSAENDTSLEWAAASHRPNHVAYLLDQEEMLKVLDLQTTYDRSTPLIRACSIRHSQQIKMLLQAGADVTLRDIWGLSPLEYAAEDNDSAYEILFRNPGAQSVLNKQRQAENWLRARQILRSTICWIQSTQDDQNHAWWSLNREQADTLILQALIRLDAVEEAHDALEIVIGPPSGRLDDYRICYHCCRSSKAPFSYCLECFGKILCDSCRELSEKEKVKGCHKHRFVRAPRPSWYTRARTAVTEDGLDERQWHERLIEKFCSQCENEPDDFKFEVFFDFYDTPRPDIFQFIEKNDNEGFRKHFDLFPRDIALHSPTKGTLAMAVAQMAANDDECLDWLKLLRLCGCRLLSRSTEGLSPVHSACQKGYEKSLTFLLQQYDPDFDKAVDPFSSEALQMMITNQWSAALQATIDRHFDWAATERFSWLKDLPLFGFSDAEIAKLLLDPPSPGKEPMSSEELRGPIKHDDRPVEHGLPVEGKHRKGCACYKSMMTAMEEVNLESTTPKLDATAHKDRSSSDTSSEIDRILELSGIGQYRHDDIKLLNDPLADEDRVTLSIASLIEDQYDAYQTYNRIERVGINLLAAMRLAQNSSLCCETFSVLTTRENSDSASSPPSLRLSRIQFFEVLYFVDLLKEGSKYWRDAGAHYSPDRKEILHSKDTVSLSRAKSILDKAISEAKVILKQLFRIRVKSSDDFEENLQLCTLVLQTLCIGFSFYLCGYLHSSKLPFFQKQIEKIYLTKRKNGESIALRPYRLTCVGDMLRSKVYAFSYSQVDNREDQNSRQKKRDLLARPMDIIDIWGPGICISEPADLGGETPKNHFQALEIFDGHVKLDGDEDHGFRKAHWFPWPYEPKTASQTFNTDDWILIGTLHTNSACRFRASANDNWERANRAGHLVRLDTRVSFWALVNRQLTAGFSATYVTGGVVFEQAKNTNLPLKLSIMNEWRDHDPRALTHPWGMLWSVCTGFARRVSLREAIGRVLDPFLNHAMIENPNGGTVPDNWITLKSTLKQKLLGESTVSEDDNNNAFIEYFKDLRPQDRPYVQAAITCILYHLKETGIDSAKEHFKVAWPNERDPRRAYEFPCSGDTHWSKIFDDTREVATFAIAVSECLVTHPLERPFATGTSCRCANESLADPIPLRLLGTKLLPYKVEGSVLDNWSLNMSTSYTYLAESPSSNRPCLLKRVGNQQFARDFLLIMASWTEIPWRSKAAILRLRRSSQILRENHENYTLPGPGGPQAAILCSLSEWRRENHIQ